MMHPNVFQAFFIASVLILAPTMAAAQHGGGHGDAAERQEWSETTPAGRVAEVAQIAATVAATHPRGAELLDNPDWAAAVQELTEVAAGDSQAAYLVSLMGLLAVLEDGHTTVPVGYALGQGYFPERLPIRFRVFDDGLFVTAAKDEAEPLLGGRVTNIGGEPIEEIARRFAAFWPGDNVAWAYHDMGLIGLPALLEGMGIVETSTSPVEIAVSFADGEMARATLMPRPDASDGRVAMERAAYPREEWETESGEPNFFRRLPNERAIYVRIGTVTNTETQLLVDLTRQLADALEEPGYDRLILDIRDNAGGNNMLAERLRRTIQLSRFNAPGSLYVLTNQQTFSAAMNIATRFERDTFATFVGEPTGAAPNSYGDHAFQTTPVTGLGYMVSTLPWFDSMPMDERRWIMPDVLVAQTYADWVAGHDAGLAAALSHETMRDREEFEWYIPWERASQAETWTPFWQR